MALPSISILTAFHVAPPIFVSELDNSAVEADAGVLALVSAEKTKILINYEITLIPVPDVGHEISLKSDL